MPQQTTCGIFIPHQKSSLSLWSRSTDFKIQDCQRTNPREYQIVRTPTKETTWIQNLASPNHHSTLCRMPYLNNNNKNKNTNQIISRQDYHLTQVCLSEEKQINKQTKKKQAQISYYKKLTQVTGPSLGGQKPKGRKNSILKPGERRPQTQ